MSMGRIEGDETSCVFHCKGMKKGYYTLNNYEPFLPTVPNSKGKNANLVSGVQTPRPRRGRSPNLKTTNKKRGYANKQTHKSQLREQNPHKPHNHRPNTHPPKPKARRSRARELRRITTFTLGLTLRQTLRFSATILRTIIRRSVRDDGLDDGGVSAVVDDDDGGVSSGERDDGDGGGGGAVCDVDDGGGRQVDDGGDALGDLRAALARLEGFEDCAAGLV